ncbi:uncharacterized protein [Branchiostoma lanceolatum]|uniref:uncharacterized protein n=1 Tax=Branchiostoma lanceolatum TaxID=7740 RepID=UPI003453D7C3
MTSSLRVPIAADILVFTRRPAARARQQSCRQKKFSEMEESEIVCPLSDYARSLAPHVRQRYQEKISAVGIDPFLIQDEQLDADRLPPMESLDLVSYLVLETSFYSQERFKAYKSLEAYNYVVSGFVESVKGKRIDGKHVVVGKVKHSQKWNDPCVLVWVITSPGGTILSAHCRDCLAGLGECCSHVASVLFYLEMYHRVSADVASTDLANAWLPPALSRTASALPMENIDFSSPKKLKNNMTMLAGTCAEPPPSHDVLTEEEKKHTPSEGEMNELFENLDKVKFKPVVLSTDEQHCESFIPKSKYVSTISDLSDGKYLKMSYDQLMEACSNVHLQLSDDDRKLIEEDTRDQARGGSFFKHRAGRIGASMSKQACATNPAQPSQSLIRTICYPKSFTFTTEATEHGCKHEQKAVAEYEKFMQTQHTNFRVHQCGMSVHPEHQFLHATPDFVCSCDCCGQGCGEVKCPYCLKEMDFDEYVKKRSSCMDQTFLLKKDHKYYYQVQQQLFATGKSYCDFVVCSVSDSRQARIAVERIKPDLEHWNTVVPKLAQFWRFCILPEILGRWFTQKRDIDLQPATGTGICFCRSASDSQVVKCTSQTCPITTFHLSCLKITGVPAKWLCPLCHISHKSSKLKSVNTKSKKTSAAPQKALKLQSICVCKKTPMVTDKLLECHNDSCGNGKFFHLHCINYKKMPNNASTTWLCLQCRKKQRVSKSFQQEPDTASSVNHVLDLEREGLTITSVNHNNNIERFAPLCNLTDDHYALITDPSGWLDCDIIHNAHVLLKRVNPSMDGLQRTTLGPWRTFARVKNPFIQILHTGRSHWVCCSTVKSNDGVVDLYDSLFHNIIQAEIEEQVKCLVGEDNNEGLRVVAVQQQPNSVDCGVFAIAFATCLAYGILPQSVDFNQPQLRAHLASCFKNEKLELFPTY